MSRRVKRGLVTTLDPAFVDLVEEYRMSVAGSVSDLEVAVKLEANGIGDADAGEYGCRDIFELASRLRAVVGGDGWAATPAHLPDWFGSPMTALIRGITYVLAGVMSMAVARTLHDPWAAPVLLSVNVTATGLMHALSYLAHLVLGRNNKTTRRPALRPMLRLCLLLAVAVGLTIGLVHSPLLGLLAGLPIAYVSSAVVLLVLGRQWRVIACIVPGGALCLATLLGPSAWFPTRIAFSVAGAGVVMLVGSAWFETRGKVKGKVSAIGILDIRAAFDHLAGGLALAGIVGANLLCVASARQLHHASAKQWFLLALPFFIPLISAEALVILFRRGLRRQLAHLNDPAQFKRAAWLATLRLWAAHLALGAIAIGLSLALHPIPRSAVVWGAMAAFLATSTLLLFCLLAGVSGRERMIIGFLAPAILVLLLARAGSQWWTGTRSLTLALAVLALAAVGFAGRLAVVSSRIEAFR
jgi:hypothetical protein